MGIERLATVIKAFRVKLPKQVALLTNDVAQTVIYIAAAHTPVDTTKAISNWQVGLGNAPNTELAARVPGNRGSTYSASLAQVHAEARERLVNRTVGTEIHIVNNAPYIESLNDGTISQQPGSFVQKAIFAGKRKVKTQKLKIF